MVGSQIMSQLSINSDISITCLDAHDFDEWHLKWKPISTQLFDLIIHCGAISDSRETGLHLWQMNFMTIYPIIYYAKSHNSQILFFSSCMALNASTQYGLTKQMCEDFLTSAIYEDNLCIFRPFSIYSYHESQKKNPSVFHKSLHQQLPVIYRNVFRDFIHVSDVVSAVNCVIKEWQPGLFDVGTGVETNVENLSRICYRNKYLPPIKDPSPDFTMNMVADTQKMLNDWQPQFVDWRIKAARDPSYRVEGV